MSELLLREYAHRTANVLAVATSAVELAARRAGVDAKTVLALAGERLRALGAVNSLLARPTQPIEDASGRLRELCDAMVTSRACRSTAPSIDLEKAIVDGPTARRLLLVAAELLENAFRHAADLGAGSVRIHLRRHLGAVVLLVENPTVSPDRGAARSTGYGSGIVAQLVDEAGGSIDVWRKHEGFGVRVELPVGSANAA